MANTDNIKSLGYNEVKMGYVVAQIVNGASLSDVIDLWGCLLGAIQTPSAMTGTALTFQGSYDGLTFNNVYDDSGTELSVTSGASRVILIDPATFGTIRYLKVRSGSSGTPTSELATRNLILHVRST